MWLMSPLPGRSRPPPGRDIGAIAAAARVLNQGGVLCSHDTGTVSFSSTNTMGETSGETLIFTCAGAAHCGQVANRTAVQLTADGAGKIFCLAAVSAGIPEKVKRTRDAGMRVVIDGCSDH